MKAKCSCVTILASSLGRLLKVSWWPKCQSKSNQLGLTPYFIIILNLHKFRSDYAPKLVALTLYAKLISPPPYQGA